MNLPRTADFRVGVLAGWKAGGTGSWALGRSRANRMLSMNQTVQCLYSTLAVRLGQSGLFSTGRAEMWRNAAVFTARVGGKCGLLLHEAAEGRGRLILFFPDEDSSAETRFHFDEFIVAQSRQGLARIAQRFNAGNEE